MDNFHFLKEVTKDIEPEGFAVSSIRTRGIVHGHANLRDLMRQVQLG